MNRQQRRASERRDQKSKTKTYVLTEDQLQQHIRTAIEKELKEKHQEMMDDAVNTAMVLLLTLPLEVLMDHYWQKSYQKRIPEFTSYVLEYYDKWQNGDLDMEKLKQDLWDYGGVRLEASK